MDAKITDAIFTWSQKNLRYIDWQIVHEAQLLIAVSGGRDSSFLLHLAVVWYQKGLLDTPPHIFHLDHRVRKNSAKDLDFVCSLAQEYRLPCTAHTISVPKFAKKSQMNLEEAGRYLRYRRLRRQAQILQRKQSKLNMPILVCTGHHANDYVESVLMHLIRGGGQQTWATLPLLSTLAPAIACFRPLSGINSAEIRDLAQHWHLPFRQDETNIEQRFLRNRLRSSVLPTLESEGLQPALIWKNMHNGHYPGFWQAKGKPTERVPAKNGPAEGASVNSAPVNSAPADYLWLDRHCFDSPLTVKPYLDLMCRGLQLHPLGHKSVLTLVHSWFSQQPAAGAAGSLYFQSRMLIVWANQKSPIYFFRKDSKCLQPPRVQLECQDLPSLPKKFAQSYGKRFSILYNRKTIKVSLSENQNIDTFRPGFFMQTQVGRKKLKKIFQEKSVPLPVRNFLPLIVNKESKEVEKIFWEFWLRG